MYFFYNQDPQCVNPQCVDFRYIVECSPDVQPPRYLRENDMYNLEQVADPKKNQKFEPFHCLRPADWPAKETLDLDESQMEAFQLALTQELAIIQGPPGTGRHFYFNHRSKIYINLQFKFYTYICINIHLSIYS